MKQCRQCKLIKKDTDFSPNKRNKDKLNSYCKLCQSIRVKEWRKNNPEKIKYQYRNRVEYYRKYYQRPDVKKRMKEYRNTPKMKEYYRKWSNEYYHKNKHKLYTFTKPIIKKCDLCEIEYITVQYHQKYCSVKCRNRVKNKKKEKGSRKRLKWKPLYPNPFDVDEDIHLHHITPEHVLALPAEIHFLYNAYHTRNDNDCLDYIIEQFYPTFNIVKRTLRKEFEV